MQKTRQSNRRWKIRKLKCDGRTAKGRPPWLSLPWPLSGCLSGCLPLSLRQPLPLCLLLLHRDIKLIVDAWVLLVENDLESKTGRENTPSTALRIEKSFTGRLEVKAATVALEGNQCHAQGCLNRVYACHYVSPLLL